MIDLRVGCALLLLLGCGPTDAEVGGPPDPTKPTDPSAIAPTGSTPDGEQWCNGGPWCERPYNEVVQLCTHNAYSTEADGFAIPTPNQSQPMATQLADGVRCLMLDTYEQDGEPYLCHGLCGPWGERPLHEGLVEIGDWLRSRPTEVLTFILEAYIDEATTEQALIDAGLDGLLYFHDAPPGTPWPTLGELVDRGERLVVFTDDDAANNTWHLDWDQYAWETPYDDPSFTCADNRGDPTATDNQVFILNHYTTCPAGGCAENAVANNTYDFVLERAETCARVDPAYNPSGQLPTFINVDHYDVPRDGGPDDTRIDALEAVRALDALWEGG